MKCYLQLMVAMNKVKKCGDNNLFGYDKNEIKDNMIMDYARKLKKNFSGILSASERTT